MVFIHAPMDTNHHLQYITDKLVPHVYPRWAIKALLTLLYSVRVVSSMSHAFITYCLGIYLLHSFILFVTPKDENIPDPFENIQEEIYNPKNIDNEFRPYVRKMPEFNFWMVNTLIIGCSFFLVLFDFTDVQVFTPIFVIYFIFILSFTLHKLWDHSTKFRYNWFSSVKASLDN